MGVIQKLIECHKLHINNFKQKQLNIDKDFIHIKCLWLDAKGQVLMLQMELYNLHRLFQPLTHLPRPHWMQLWWLLVKISMDIVLNFYQVLYKSLILDKQHQEENKNNILMMFYLYGKFFLNYTLCLCYIWEIKIFNLQ